MSVSKYQININSLSATTASTINIPLNLEFQLVDQSELIEKEFVNIEIENNINPILDYEKVRFTPVNSTFDIFDNIAYKIIFNGGINNYGGIGYTDDDIKFRKNAFKLSFLRLNFYDTDKATDQRLLSYITIYPKITDIDLHPLNSTVYTPSSVKPANQIFTTFILDNPLNNSKGTFEGFYIYHYKDEVTTTLPKELFMRASFNNAKSGKTTNLMTVSSAQSIDNLVNKLHTKYILKKNNSGYYYEIDNTYSTNINISGKNLTINLYQIQSL